MPQSDDRIAIGIAACLGALVAAIFLQSHYGISLATALLCPPALLVYPVYLELELRFPSVRAFRAAWYLAGALVILLNAVYFGLLMHAAHRMQRFVSRQ